MPTDLFGDSVLLSLGFMPEDNAYIFGTIEAKIDAKLGTWVLGHIGNSPTTANYPLQATDLVAFCHRSLVEGTSEPQVQSAQRLLSKAIVLRQALRLGQGGVTS